MIGIGVQFAAFTKAEFQKGKIPFPGTRAQTVDPVDGSTREYIVVQFNAGATRLNGQMVTINGAHVATLGTAGGVGLLVGGRAGVVAINAKSSVAATQTMAGTHFCWAQIYGRGNVLTGTVSVSGANAQFQFAADGLAAIATVGSASALLVGIIGQTASQAAAGLFPVLLTYPQFYGSPA